MKEDVQKALSVGMNAHIAKPIKEERLEKILKEYFSFNITTTKQKQLKSSYDIEIEGVDLVSVQKKLNIDTKELYNLYKNFYNDYRAAALISNPQGLNQEELRVFVHKLKGVSGNLEMAAIYELCSKIVQKGATSMDLERLKSKLIHTLQEIKSKIVPYLLEHRSTQEPKTLEETTQLLSEVVSKLENAQYLSRESIVELYESLEERIDKSSQRAILKLFDALEDEKLERLLKKIKKWLHKR
ncbi:MAG: hypothetical protein U9N49_13065, partial [Campylobacterota bacterium]|nr:hypothetical protein [Campylobacterota bacterium]